jgi:hypothetical protein
MWVKEERPMKAVIFVAFVGIGVILAFSSSSGTGGAQQQPGWKQGIERADAYMQSVLTPEVDSAFTEKAHASADWLDGWKKKVADAAD